MIAGLESITDGDLLIDGTKANDIGPADRGLAMVFQSYALYPHMTVADNMAFSLRLAGVSKEERMRKVTEAANVLHLGPLLERRPKELSGGQRQRVAIGRAIVRQPKVFLFDEPLSNLDAALRVQMRIELAKLHEKLAATMIYVTHDQIEAMTMADKIVVLQAIRSPSRSRARRWPRRAPASSSRTSRRNWRCRAATIWSRRGTRRRPSCST
jgi:multiple sugar transport system ATP-binding protein